MQTVKAHDLTQGGILRNLADFAVPYLCSYFLQILYGMADLFIIGRYCGVESTTAVSIGSQVMHMLTVVIIGLAMGTTVVVGQSVGAGNLRRTALVVGNTVTLFMCFALFLMAVLLVAADGIVGLVSTPAEAVEGTRRYLSICFLGIPFIVAYNIIAGIFRGLGDSRSPMYFIAIACVTNIVLDYVFIGLLDMKAAGAALGTTLAQALSVVVSLVMIRRRRLISIVRSDLRPRQEAMGAVLRIGVPVALQDGFIQVAFIVITVIANLRGLTDAAAVGIVEKVIGAVFLVPSSLLSAVSVICAQNIGAGKLWRARHTLRDAVLVAAVYGVVVAAVMQFLDRQTVGLFTSDAAVVRSGANYLRSYIWDTVFAGIHFCFSGFFCACGRAVLSFVHNLASTLLVRIPFSWLLSAAHPESLYPMGWATPAGSFLSVLICAGFYLWMLKKVPQTLARSERK